MRIESVWGRGALEICGPGRVDGKYYKWRFLKFLVTNTYEIVSYVGDDIVCLQNDI
jgi:hypothetical protein